MFGQGSFDGVDVEVMEPLGLLRVDRDLDEALLRDDVSHVGHWRGRSVVLAHVLHR